MIDVAGLESVILFSRSRDAAACAHRDVTTFYKTRPSAVRRSRVGGPSRLLTRRQRLAFNRTSVKNLKLDEKLTERGNSARRFFRLPPSRRAPLFAYEHRQSN
ncbi:hypothetical protein EVAR_18165_1 [Eumeta japonica]|uniref:Uncharacterized protein n=1 Tax=Eumeta variegata TaxID=151549 RepID=A0A4C1UWH1_EUMVA|nr:hypothetical protein EVAR_18165_1 [Eumeta japonica]